MYTYTHNVPYFAGRLNVEMDHFLRPALIESKLGTNI